MCGISGVGILLGGIMDLLRFLPFDNNREPFF